MRLAVIAHHTWGEGNDKNRKNITVVDLETYSIVTTLQAGKEPIAVAINSFAHEASVANEKSNDITFIDLNTLSVKGAVQTDKHPAALAYNECLNTFAVIGGEDKSWMTLMGMNAGAVQSSHAFNNKVSDIVIHPTLNKAFISGKEGLISIALPNPVPQLASSTPDKRRAGNESNGEREWSFRGYSGISEWEQSKFNF